MADYYTQTVLQEMIPDAEMTPLERLLLSHVFEVQREGDAWYFFSEQGPSDMLYVAREELESALAASSMPDENVANTFVRDSLAKLDPIHHAAPSIELDLSAIGWEFIVQNIVRRSMTLKYVSAISSFTCSKMRSDGFGGAVVVISADEILGKSTNDFLEEFVAQVAA